jgi:uncharacterized protein
MPRTYRPGIAQPEAERHLAEMADGGPASEPRARWVIPARGYSGFTLERGATLRIVDLEGQQVADLVCFNLADRDDVLNLANSLHINERLEFERGDGLFSVDCNRMMTVVGYSNARSFAYGSMCSEELNRVRFGIAGTPSCRQNLADALEPWGIPRRALPNAFVPFMNFVVLDDGRVESQRPTSVAGDHYDLRAEMDLIVGLSNCPQELNAVNGEELTPIGVEIFAPGQRVGGDE